MGEFSPVKRAGVIGLGAMGLQMARHIANSGIAVAGYDIVEAQMRAAADYGVARSGSPADLARNAEVVVVMVQTDAQVEEVFQSGLIDNLAAGSVVCIASSVAPETCRRLAELASRRGIGVLDTPVVLGQEACNEGTLTVLAGGEEKWLERARPVLAAFSRHILHLGPVGHGQIAKAVNNMLLWACISANFEALTLAKQVGADIPRLIDALAYSSGANWSLSRWGKSTGKWAQKDLDAALTLAKQAKVALPLATLVDELMQSINQESMRGLLE